MVILGFAFWIGWHVIQTRQENAEIESDDDMPEENGWRGLPQNAEATRLSPQATAWISPLPVSPA